MELTLNVLRCPDSVVPEMRRVGGGEYRLGRGPENDWVLPDPDRVLSKQHCVFEFHNGGWQVRDTSTNGTFHNGSSMPIGRDLTAYLHDGDRVRLGPYDIEVRVNQQGAQAGAPGGQAWGTPAPAAQPQWDTPLPSSGPAWGGEPGWAGQPEQRLQPVQPRMAGDAFAIGGADAPPLPGMGPGGMGHGDPHFSDEGPAMPDRASNLNAAYYVPPPLPMAPTPSEPPMQFAPPAPGARPPEGWRLDLSAPAPQPEAAPPAWQAPAAPPPFAPAPPMAPQAAPAPFTPPPGPVTPPAAMPPPGLVQAPQDFSPAPAPQPAAPPLQGFAPPPPAPPFASPVPAGGPPPAPAHNPFENEQSLRAPGLAPIAPPVPVTAPPPAGAFVSPPVGAAAVAPPAAASPPPIQAGSADASAVAALMAGMGLAPTAALTADPNSTLRAAGAALRAAISGIRALLIARADVKREFRIEATMLGVANNPVKFSHNDDAALLALLGSAAIGPGAVQETVNDLTAHQVATLAATQAAARALLDRLAPGGLESTDQGGSLFGAGRDKRLWDAYKRLHQQVTQQFEDDFDSAFGKAFARAYEQALRDGRG